MPIAKSTSKVQTTDDDARVAPREELVQRTRVTEPEPRESSTDDPYDNIACTD